MSCIDPVLSSLLAKLETFRMEVWGKPNAFEYHFFGTSHLDFGTHLSAVRIFCPAVRSMRLYIFPEYLAAFEAFADSTNFIYTGGACITGQPGIGKSCFIAYAVVERLRKGQPVAVGVSHLENNISYLLFDANGATLHTYMDGAALEKHPGIWAFSDSTERSVSPMAVFTNTLNVRIFQVASPEMHRHKEWRKQHMIHLYIMDIPSIQDVVRLGSLLDMDVRRMNGLADKFGPVPRTLLDLCIYPALERFKPINDLLVLEKVERESAKLEKYFENGIRTKVWDVVNQPPWNIKAALSDPDIFFIRPASEETRLSHQVFVPTSWLHDQVVDGLRRRGDRVRVELYEALNGYPETRSVSEVLFKGMVSPEDDEGIVISELEAHEPVDDTGVYFQDIELVMAQVGCSRATAVRALKDSGGDLINAIMAASE